MIVLEPRNGEVVIEDGWIRLVVREDGSGYVHENHEVFPIDIHEPHYVKAAKNAGLEIPDQVIEDAKRTYGLSWQ